MPGGLAGVGKSVGKSLILSWAICERLLNKTWQRYINSQKGEGDGAIRMNKDRRKS